LIFIFKGLIDMKKINKKVLKEDILPLINQNKGLTKLNKKIIEIIKEEDFNIEKEDFISNIFFFNIVNDKKSDETLLSSIIDYSDEEIVIKIIRHPNFSKLLLMQIYKNYKYNEKVLKELLNTKILPDNIRKEIDFLEKEPEDYNETEFLFYLDLKIKELEYQYFNKNILKKDEFNYKLSKILFSNIMDLFKTKEKKEVVLNFLIENGYYLI